MQINILDVVIMDTLTGMFSEVLEICVLGTKYASSILKLSMCFGKVACPTQHTGLMYIQKPCYL